MIRTNHRPSRRAWARALPHPNLGPTAVGTLALVFALCVPCISLAATGVAAGDSYGAAVDPAGAQPVAEVLAAVLLVPASPPSSVRAASPTKVAGRVVGVCQSKGCWMELRSESDAAGEAPALRVTFKDYGFFVPQAIAGARVVVEGELVRKEQSVKELRHLAADAGRSADEIEAIREPQTGWSIVASGVRVVEAGR